MKLMSLITGVLGLSLQELNASQDRKQLRNAIRQRILAANLHLLDTPEGRMEVAQQFVASAWGVNSTNILGALIIAIITRFIKADKVDLVKDVLDAHYEKLMALRVEEHDDATMDFHRKDKDEAKDFIRDVMALL